MRVFLRAREAIVQRLKQAGKSAFAAFVRGRTDRQLERTVGSRPGLRVIFKAMERAFEPDRANGFEGDIQYVLVAHDGGAVRGWVVRIEGDRATGRPGRSPAPIVTLKTSVSTLSRIAAGEANPAEEMIEGRLEISGSFAVAVQLGEMFGEQPARPVG